MFPLKGSFTGDVDIDADIEIDIGRGVDMDIDVDVAVSVNWGSLDKGFRTPLKGLRVDPYKNVMTGSVSWGSSYSRV